MKSFTVLKLLHVPASGASAAYNNTTAVTVSAYEFTVDQTGNLIFIGPGGSSMREPIKAFAAGHWLEVH